MFAQVMKGKASDANGLRRQLERWDRELRPGATGYLGGTGGVADDGTFVAVIRFESEEAARRNSERSEQGAWWAETQPHFDGEVSFQDCTEVEAFLLGDPDQAGFVQVIQGRARDQARLRELDEEILKWFPEMRPDFLGNLRGWAGEHFTEFAYFTSEAAAREGEQRLGDSDEAAQFEQWLDQVDGLTFVDLRSPWLFS